MAERLDPKDFGLKMYSRFPHSYRVDDVDQKYALRRYLEAAADGGFKYTIEEQNGILDLINPQTSPLDVVYLLYEQYGLDLFHGIPEEFLRAFLPNLGFAWSKKGSLDVVEYIVSSLSGIKTSTEVTYDEFDNPIVTVRLEMDFSVSDYFPNTQQFERILENFIPFYCDALLIYSYVYYEEQDLIAREQFLDKVKDFMLFEDGNIFYGAGYRPGAGMLNNPDKVLNDTFILNETELAGYEYEGMLNNPDRVLNDSFVLNPPYKVLPQYDVDYCTDRIIAIFKESTGIKRDFILRPYKAFLNTDLFLLNDTFILNDALFEDTTVAVLNVEDVKLNENFILNKDSAYSSGGLLGEMILGEDYFNGLYSEPIVSDRKFLQAPVDDFTDRVIPVALEDSVVVKSKEYTVTAINTTHNEEAGVLSKGRKDIQSSVLGEAVLGESVLNEYGDYADVCKDIVHESVAEQIGLEPVVNDEFDSALNTGAVLNDSFILSVGLDRLDTVIKNGLKLNDSFILNESWLNADTQAVFTL